MTGASRVEEQSGSLNGIARHDDGAAPLEMLFAVAVNIHDTVNPAVARRLMRDAIAWERISAPCVMASGTCVYQSARFGADLTSLQAEPTIDAMWTVSMRGREYCDRASRNRANAEPGASAHQYVTDTTQGMRPVRMSVGIAPRKPCWSGNGNLALQEFVVGLQIPIRDGPIDANAVFRVHTKVRGMKARRESRPMDGASTNALAASCLRLMRGDEFRQ